MIYNYGKCISLAEICEAWLLLELDSMKLDLHQSEDHNSHNERKIPGKQYLAH